MIRGRVTANNEAVISVEILGPEGQTAHLEAGLDTGYNGFLTLPAFMVEELNLPFAGTAGAALGDGNEVRMDLYLAAIRWQEKLQDILVLETDGGVLVGMAMLSGNRVTLEVEENGTVSIEPLAPS